MTAELEPWKAAECQDTAGITALLALTSLTGAHIPAHGPRNPTPYGIWTLGLRCRVSPERSPCLHPCWGWPHLLNELQTHVTVLFPVLSVSSSPVAPD